MFNYLQRRLQEIFATKGEWGSDFREEISFLKNQEPWGLLFSIHMRNGIIFTAAFKNMAEKHYWFLLAVNHCLPYFFFCLKGYFNWKALHIWHLLPKWSRKPACTLGVVWISLSDRKFPDMLLGVPRSCKNQPLGLCWSRVTFQSLISPWEFWYLFCSYESH